MMSKAGVIMFGGIVIPCWESGGMTEPVVLRVRPENFGVPLRWVEVQFDEAVWAWQRCREDRYAAGVFEAFRWLTVLTKIRPVSRDEVVATPEAILEELVRAGSVAGGIPCPGAPIGVIHPVWALGVECALGWSRGTSLRQPLPWPGGHPPAVS